MKFRLTTLVAALSIIGCTSTFAASTDAAPAAASGTAANNTANTNASVDQLIQTVNNRTQSLEKEINALKAQLKQHRTHNQKQLQPMRMHPWMQKQNQRWALHTLLIHKQIFLQ